MPDRRFARPRIYDQCFPRKAIGRCVGFPRLHLGRESYATKQNRCNQFLEN
ncbi:hypothetical protein PDR5_04640 [Pseudomonas sp. DR 5-09]|nr:hypothetical protein PDR5_04640 [Pseudomonas sp. DR 5-09]